MLHRYGELSVMTLDSFTNRLVKSFARRALDQDYRIELDQDRLVDEAVGNVLDRIGAPGEEELTELLKGFARLQVEEEKDSRIRHPLTTYGKEVLKESMRNTLEALGDMTPEDFRELSEQIRKDVKVEERELKARVKVAMAEVKNKGWSKRRRAVRCDQWRRINGERPWHHTDLARHVRRRGVHDPKGTPKHRGCSRTGSSSCRARS